MSKQRPAESVTEHRLRDLFTRTFNEALAGDTALMREYIDTAAGFIKNGTPLPPELRAFVVDAFKAIGNGEDPATALKLKRGRRQTPRLRDLAIVSAVHQLVTQDMSINEASRIVADEYAKLVQSKRHSSPELAGPIVAAPAVKKLYERYRNQLTDAASIKQRK